MPKDDRPIHDPPPAAASGPATWSLLLAKWIEFAKASVALPDDTPDGAAWKASVTHLITLQSVTFALGDAAGLPPAERRVARDRAAVSIREAAAALSKAWAAQPMPEQLLELMQDARDALRLMESLALMWFVTADRFDAPDFRPIADDLLAAGFRGTLLAPRQSTTLLASSPAVVILPEPEPAHADIARALHAIDQTPALDRRPGVAPALQLYRQPDESDPTIRRDLAVPLATSLPPGMPLLLPLIQDGATASPHARPSPLPIDATAHPVVFEHHADVETSNP